MASRLSRIESIVRTWQKARMRDDHSVIQNIIKILDEPKRKPKIISECTHCSHPAHFGSCSHESYNGYSCRCKTDP